MSYKYWSYYLYLENDLIATKRFVDFNQDNMSIYSIEFARIILASCAEIDMVFKELCKLITNTKCDNIKKYRETILNYDSSFNTRKRNVAYIKSVETPYQIWNLQNGDNPEWWRSYNAIKHERSTSFARASLKNAILSLTGLQIVLFEYYTLCNNVQFLTFEYKDTPKLILPNSAGSSLTQAGLFINFSK